MINKIKENFITVSLTLIMALLIFNAGLIFYNRQSMIANNRLQDQTEEVRRVWTGIFESNLRRMDLGLRGYALTRNPQLLDPYRTGVRDMPVSVRLIDSLLAVQGLDSTRQQFASFAQMLNDYVAHSETMRTFAERDSLEAFVGLLNQDKGYDLWQAFAPMFTSVLAYQDQLMEEARLRYQRALNRNVIFQVALIIITIPSLIAVIYRIRRETRARKKLLKEFEENNRKYLFDPGTDLEDKAEKIISNSIHNLKKTSTFIKSIAGGDYSVNWEGLNDQNSALNKDNLTGNLIKMRDQMKSVKENDERRIWNTDGLARFSEVARNNQNNIEKLSNEVIRFLTKHMRAQQGSLFILHDEQGEDTYLKLSACYAFDKKKYVEKRIGIGSGLVGEAFLQRQPVLLTEVPKGYISITSGLGDATPRCLVIIPMKYNDRVEAVLELASFNKFELHEVEFLEKAGEVIASSISATKINERTSKLLSETQQQAESLRSQEEELRQNMEEMQATQESLKRLEKDSINS